MVVRRLATAVAATLGLLTFVFGVVVVLAPRRAEAVPAEAAAALAGSDYQLVAALAAVGLAASLVVLALRATGGVEQARPPDPEGVRRTPHPGAELDAVVDGGVGLRTRLFTDRVTRVRERLQEAAIGVLMRRRHCTREEARSLVDSGEWTTDAVAAAFLGAGRPPVAERVRAALRGNSWHRRGIRRSADEIARHGRVVDDDGGTEGR